MTAFGGRTLRRGMRGGDVAEWQKILERAGYDLSPFGADGIFGRLTERATIRFQLDRGLQADGIVGRLTRAATKSVQEPKPIVSEELEDDGPFLQAKGWTWANRQDIRLIVVHTMEHPERPDSAEAVAAWFAGLRGEPPKASSHATVDVDSLVRCVRPEHVAWTAPGANHDGYHIEHAGYAKQVASEWADEYSKAMLRRSATHAAKVARRYEIPVRKLNVSEVRDGRSKGFCAHVDVSRAFGKSNHTDPGQAFPWPDYLDLVRDVTFLP